MDRTGTHRPRDTSKGRIVQGKTFGDTPVGNGLTLLILCCRRVQGIRLWHWPTAFDILTKIGIHLVPDTASILMQTRNLLFKGAFNLKNFISRTNQRTYTCHEGGGSVVDKDSHGPALILLPSIQIRIGKADPVPDSGARKLNKINKWI